MAELPDSQPAPRSTVRRWLPLVFIAAVSTAVIGMGWHRNLSLETLVRYHDTLQDFIAANFGTAIAVYVGVYVATVALSIPGAVVLTLAGGILFGGLVGGAGAIAGASAGATIIFSIARTAFGEHIARRAGPLAARLAAEFRADAFNYLLFLRLVPVFPFFLVNLVAALVGVRPGTFVAATAIGIVPGGFAFAFIGAGLESVVRAQSETYRACLAAGGGDCGLDFHMKAAVTPELIAGLVALGAIALLPVVVKRLRAHRAKRS